MKFLAGIHLIAGCATDWLIEAEYSIDNGLAISLHGISLTLSNNKANYESQLSRWKGEESETAKEEWAWKSN